MTGAEQGGAWGSKDSTPLSITGEPASFAVVGPTGGGASTAQANVSMEPHLRHLFTAGKDERGADCDPTRIPPGALCIAVPLPTPFTAGLDLAAPLGEYPRPQLRRPQWRSLNGVWDFEYYETFEAPGDPTEAPLTKRILVPFPLEAPLSGVTPLAQGVTRMAYRRSFTVPAAWREGNQRVLLHFGAVDWEAEAWVNGRRLGLHRGGYDKFHFDVTDVLEGGANATNTLALRVYDPTESAHIALGKQRSHPPRHPSGIWYTSASGIWQTVWLEPVAPAHIERLELIPDIDAERLSITVLGSEAAAHGEALAVARSADGKEVGRASGEVGRPFNLSVPRPHLWSPDDPYLYDLEVRLGGPALDNATAAAPGDVVASYFGMRKIALGRPGGPGTPLRPLLNNRFVFQMGLLDQGYWPDGIYTAPTDEALASDISAAKALGFNLLRKHIKVEPDRWYFHADRLGMLVWQDMPSMYWEDPFSAGPSPRSLAARTQWGRELDRLLEERISHPCIVTWVVFNEGWGQQEQTAAVVRHVQRRDPSRLADPASGWVDFDVGDLHDMHLYVGPGSPGPTPTRAAVLGEFGGLGLRVDSHLWIPSDSFCYEMLSSGAELEVRYLGLMQALQQLMAAPEAALSAAVYTELADVEAEVNGLLTYDRQVLKVDPHALPAAHRALYELAEAINNGTAGAPQGTSAPGAAQLTPAASQGPYAFAAWQGAQHPAIARQAGGGGLV